MVDLEPYWGDLRTVQVEIGARQATFLFDTGGGATLITPELARELRCHPYGRDVGHRMSGERVVFQRCDRVTLRLAGLPVTHDPIAVFDVNALLPPQLPRLDGVLALDSFRGGALTLDWSRGRLVIHAAGVPLPAAGRRRWASGDNGRTLSVLLPVRTARGEAWFLLDSGNIAGTLVDRHLIDEELLALDGESRAVLQVDPGPPIRLPVQVADIDLDGALGTAWLRAAGAVTIDLRALP